MAAINVQRLDEDAVRRLKHRAAADNRSLEGEGRYIPECAGEQDDMEARRAAFRAVVDPLRHETEGREHTLGRVPIREDRDRGHRPHLGY